MTKQKVSRATAVVQMAQARYPELLGAARSYLGDIPYGKELVSPRTADKRLTQMSPDDMLALSMTNPVAAEQAAARIEVLDARAAALPRLPGESDFE